MEDIEVKFYRCELVSFVLHIKLKMNIINLLHDIEGDMNIYSLQKSYFPRALINLEILKAPLLFELSQDLKKKTLKHCC